MKRLLTLSTFLLLRIMTFASTEVDGIYYDFAGTEATVVSGANKYTGDVIIPASVTNGNQNYSVTRIYQNAFYGCTGLTSVTIPNSVTIIGASAFEGCTGLETVTNNSSISIIENRTFYNCSGLTSIDIPNSVTSIGQYAFYNCSGLTSVSIPNSVTSIGSIAFGACSGLVSIIVQDGNTVYDSRNNCNAIIATASNTLIIGCKNTIIPNNITSIGQHAFDRCSGLTSINIPNSVTEIGTNAFLRCSGLTSITIPNSVKRIRDYAFQKCSGLVSIYSYIESPTSTSSFYFDSSSYTNATLYVLKGKKNEYLATNGWKDFLKIIEFAPTYTLTYKVDDETYKTYQVEYGTTIVPEPAPTKEGYSFSGWSEIPATMPANDVTVTGTFTINKYNLTYKVDGETYKQYELAYGSTITPETAPTKTGYTFSGWSEIPKTMPANDVTVTGTFTINKYNLTYKVDGATYKTYQVAYGSTITPEPAPTKTGYTFSGWSEIPTTMPANNVIVTGTFTDDRYVGGIYYNYSGTEAIVVSKPNMDKYTGSVTIPASVTYGEQNYSVTRIYQNAFKGCSGLTSVTIPSSVTNIGASAFEGCTGLETVTNNSSISIIEDRTFYGCSGLTSVTIPSSVTNIGTSAFEGCTGLETVTDNSSISIIEDRTFYGCSGLTSINIPSNVTSIGKLAFCYCSGLTSINIPSNVTSIGQSAFGGCTGLTSIKVQEGNTKYDSRNNCNAIIETASNTLIRGCKNTVIPNSVTSIREGAFQYCSGLTSITIPNSVKSIGRSAFSGCSGLTSITIPNSVTSIGEWAFNHCSKLTSITIPNSVTSIGWDAFSGCSGLTSITIPNSVTSIGQSAFGGCSGLVSIYSYLENPTSAPGSNFDSSNYTNATLYVLKGKKNEYLATDGWKNFVKITEFAPTYTLTYKVDDETYKTYQVEYGTTIVPEPAPTKEGYIFSGWSEIPAIMPANDVTVTGTFTIINKYNLTYKVDGETYKQYEMAEGDAITPEPAPTKTGYTFSGWSRIPATMPAHNVEVYGKFYNPEDYNPEDIESAWVDASLGGTDPVAVSAGTVVASSASIEMFQAFDDSFKAVSMTGESDDANTVTIDGVTYPLNEYIGLQAQTHATPNNLGTATEGAWVGGQNSGAVFGFNVKKDGLLCVFGKLTATKQYYAWEGDVTNSVASLVAYRLVGHGVAAVEGTVPTCDYTLPAAEGSNLADADAMTASAEKWLKSSNVIAAAQVIDPNFVSGNALGVVVVPVYAEAETYYVNACGSKITSNGFVFIPKIAPTAADAANISVTFSKALPTYNLTYKVDGEIYKQYKLAEGDAITPEPAPTKEGYTFSGWSEIPATMPASDVTVTGTFTAIPDPSTENTLAVSNAETYAGKQIVLPIDMNNVASIKAFQFDLYLPEGITIAKDEDDEELIELTTRAAKSHTIAYSNRPDGAIRMVCTSMSGATFKGNEGTIVNVTLNVAPSMTDGDYDIEVKNIELSDGTPYNPADIKATLTVKTYTPGDVDGTGTVSVNDAVCVINYILGSPAEDFIEPAADLDGNGVITVNDVVILINDYILGGNSQNSLDLAFLEDVTADDDYLYIEEDNLSNMTAGEEREIEVFMNTSRTDIQGLQCDIYLPDGMEFVPEEDGDEKYYADKGGRAAKSHSVASQLMADGSVRVVETSTSGAKFKANELAVFYFTVRATANTAYGQGIRLCNMELSYGGAPINPEDRTFDVKVKAGTVSLNSEGYATFSHASDVEVEGAEVYTATRNGNIISCTKEEQSVAAFNGVILKGEPNATVTLYTNNGVEGYTGNELKATTTAAGVADIETALVLSGNMFKNYTGAAFDADKAYMPYDGNSANAIGIVFNGATAIDGIALENNLFDGAVIKTVEDGKLVIKTANGKYSSVGAKMK